MQKLALVLFFFATLVFAQFFPNWPDTNESPIGAYIVSGIILIIVLILLANHRYKNQKAKNNYRFRELDKMIMKSSSFSKKIFQAVGDGFFYSIRSIEQADMQKLIELFNQLSPESRYLRFAHAISKLPEEFLEDVLELDYEKEMALVACLQQDDNKGSIIGIARYVSDTTGNVCEYSISVSDQYAAHGVRMNLIEHLIKYAKQMKLKKMIGYILSNNTKMLRMTKELGFEIEAPENEPEFKIATLNLQK